MSTLKQDTAVGLMWNLIERLFSKCLQFVFSLLIARCLMPSAYGAIAIANVVISLSDILIDSGFSKALINKKNRTDDDYNTVFWFNIMAAFVLYALIFSVSPSVENYYGISSLSSVIRIQSLILILNALGGVQYLHLVVGMDFRTKAWIEMPCGLISGFVGLYLAFHGAGVWALVAQTVGAGVIRQICLWGVVHWMPRFRFSLKIAKEYLSFGVKVLISDYIGRMYSSLFSLVIGKRFSSTSLGLYGKASAFADTSFTFISGPIMQVTYPAISRIQNDKESMQRSFYDMFSQLAYIAFPVMFGLMVVAGPLVEVILTDNWNGMIPMLRIFSVSALLSTMSSIPGNFLNVMGYSGISLNIRVISCVTGLILFFFFCRISLIWVCIGVTMVGAVGLSLQLYYLKRVLGISYSKCFKRILPSFILGATMALTVRLIMECFDSVYIKLISGTVSCFVYFLGVSILFRMSGYVQCKSILMLLKR